MTGRAARHITAVISSLECGGAERVMSMLCNHWSTTNAVTLLTFDDGREPPFFPLAPGVRHRCLGLTGTSRHAIDAMTRNIRRVRVLRRAIAESRPDVVVSFGDRTNVSVLLATLGCRVPVVVSERSDPRNVPPGWTWSALRHLAYRRAAAIVLVSPEGRDWFGGRLQQNVRVIPNPIDLEPAPEPAPDPDDAIRFVSVGRLAHEKGHDVLLDAMARMPEDVRVRAYLTVVGDGPLREALRHRAQALGLDARVRWVGRHHDPASFVRAADIFVLPSRFEGFPNALAEAMSLGRAVVAADCRSGPGELIADGDSGLLVPPGDPDALAVAMTRLARNREERRRYAAAAPTCTRPLRLQAISDAWLQLFQDTVSQC
jgi:GalNAc-alpha-(1->4)-GalNAc-alpha-(1->3)-diNAcBac-PP-undecaprenol alpha-1,4-N-acetyl-D-galactosaminyltransferase